MDRSPFLRGWAICGDLRNSLRVNNIIPHIIKPMDLLNLVFQLYLNFENLTPISCALRGGPFDLWGGGGWKN